MSSSAFPTPVSDDHFGDLPHELGMGPWGSSVDRATATEPSP